MAMGASVNWWASLWARFSLGTRATKNSHHPMNSDVSSSEEPFTYTCFSVTNLNLGHEPARF